MINLYFLYPLNSRRFWYLVIFVLSPGIITILCHADAFFPPVDFNRGGTAGFLLTQESVRPVITGQVPNPIVSPEDQALTITTGHLQVTDPDNSYPADFTLSAGAGENYAVSGATITPAANFTGTLAVPVTVNDGETSSEPFSLQISITAVNDPPVITGQVSLSIAEDQMLALQLSHLTVVDSDNEYPGTFTLSVLSGDNYSVSGNEITPASGYNGLLTVRVFVNDGTENSNFFDVSITVTPVNDPPVITGQRPLEMTEGSVILLSLQDLTVTDPDNTFPDGFTLVVLAGENYSFSGTTVTPTPDFTGTLNVNLIVNDGVANSQPFLLQISVTPVNDAPQITGQQALLTNEDVSRAVALADLIVTDPDNAYPTGFTLVLFPGTNYTLSGNTVVPAPDFYGTLTVQVQVTDGVLTSNIFSLALQVSPVNDRPLITGQSPLETAEDAPVTIQLTHLTVLDPDNSYPSGFTLQVSSGPNYSVSGSTITPVPDFNGTLNVFITVNDGTDNSEPFAFQVQVGNANDAPVITGQAPLSTNEENPVTLALSYLTVFDPDNVYPTGFSLLVSPGIDYSVSGQTITPALNFAGVLTIPVRVNDGINNSATFNFQLQVNQINDPPVFAAIPNQQVTENAAAGSIPIAGISKGPREDDQQLTFVATSSNTTILPDPVIVYNGTGSSAVLSYVLIPNMSGVVTITIVAIDNGSNSAPHRNSYSSSFQIDVMEINSAPALAVIANISLPEDSEQQNITLTGISAGPGESQAIALSVTSDKLAFFDLLEVAYTSPGATGLLSLKIKPNIFGTALVSVTVTDNGSGVSPHVNRLTQTFTVSILPVNDPPVFTSPPVTVAVINEQYVYRISVTDADGEKVTLSVPVKPSWASLSGSNGDATLTGTPPAGTSGDVPVKLQASDATTSVEQNFNIYVNVRPTIVPLSTATEEDNSVVFPAIFFVGGYTDINGNPIAGIQVTTLPASGKLLLSEIAVKAGDTIPAGSLPGLVYTPNENYFGTDFFSWKAFDGYHFSLVATRVDISILPINDPPTVVFQHDTLLYEVNGEAAFLAPDLQIIDPDDDTLTHATIGFHARNYRQDMDLLESQNASNIRANFDPTTGLLDFTGTASVAEYQVALRSARYLYQNTLDPLLEPKVVYYILKDTENESTPKDKFILLQYTFIEFEIPSGFTPNGDNANDTWVINRPGGGLEELDNAIISVFNKQGVLVFRTKGFERPWDGTMDGEFLPADSYFFTIDLQLRNKKTYKGIVTILR